MICFSNKSEIKHCCMICINRTSYLSHYTGSPTTIRIFSISFTIVLLPSNIIPDTRSLMSEYFLEGRKDGWMDVVNRQISHQISKHSSHLQMPHVNALDFVNAIKRSTVYHTIFFTFVLLYFLTVCVLNTTPHKDKCLKRKMRRTQGCYFPGVSLDPLRWGPVKPHLFLVCVFRT